MLCPTCRCEYKSVRAGCPNCGRRRAANPSPFAMRGEEAPAERRARGRSMPGGYAGPEGRDGHSEPPAPRAESMPAAEPAGRVYGAGNVPAGPIYVRKPRERAARASVQRKVPLRRRGPRVGIIILGVLGVLLAALTAGGFFLTRTPDGQLQMAVWGWDNAPNEAYWRLGEIQMRENLTEEAVISFEKAFGFDQENESEPNVEGILNLARAYERVGKGADAMALYTSLMDEIAPERPEAYERMARIYEGEERHSEAVEMMERGHDATGSDLFTRMIRDYAPDPPYPSTFGGRFNKETRTKLISLEGTTIQYTLDDQPAPKNTPEPDAVDTKDPLRFGKVYEEEDLIFGEGTTRVRAVAIHQNGVPSKEMDETYTVVFPTPNAPRANHAPKEYDYQPNVQLFADKGIVEIHYTIDGTPATRNSPLYTGPIKLPLGKSTLRAIAIDHRGKESYEMSVSYKVKGATKKIFNKEDVFDKLALMKTTYEQFERTYGAPRHLEQIESSGQDKLFRADYGFGYACFVQAGDADKKLLYELMVEGGSIKGPRKISIGDSEDKVLGAFRDMGSQANERGERVLYKGETEGNLGTYTLEEDGGFAAHYYYPRDKNDYVELSFYFQNGRVTRMHWLRYVGDV